MSLKQINLCSNLAEDFHTPIFSTVKENKCIWRKESFNSERKEMQLEKKNMDNGMEDVMNVCRQRKKYQLRTFQSFKSESNLRPPKRWSNSELSVHPLLSNCGYIISRTGVISVVPLFFPLIENVPCSVKENNTNSKKPN